MIDIDAEPVATALVGLDDDLRGIVFRNMSKRAVAFIKEDTWEREGAAPPTTEAACAFSQQLLDKHEARAAR
ncbi:MAG: FliG C-terminal domain-containing protein [Spirochaetaceae bacterium]|nr:FliG C-terminal domain-containing protein [Spirochaetaceae bacterium]